jgi:hypothetical protein
MENGLKIDLKAAETVKCEKCEGTLFSEVFSFKKVSKLLTGSSQDALVPFPMYKCENCNHINDEFQMPE